MRTTLCIVFTLFTFVILAFLPNSFAQETSPEYIVRQIYFHPSDRPPHQGIDTTLDTLVNDVQQFCADEMKRHGFGRKTFRLETDAQGNPVRHYIQGRFTSDHYDSNRINQALTEIDEHFDRSGPLVYLIFIDDDNPDSTSVGQVGGVGGGGPFRGTANITLLDFHKAPEALYPRAFNTIAHELGHAFGLPHDFRDDRYIMSYGPEHLKDQLSYCAAEWLDTHRYFNTTQSSIAQQPRVQMLGLTFVSSPNTVRLRFKITHSEKLHQALLLTNALRYSGNPVFDPTVMDCKSLKANTATIEFITSELAPASEYVALRVIDAHGNFAYYSFPIDMSTVLPVSEPVLIPDANLAAAIRETLGLAPQSTIRKLDMLGLGRLRAVRKQITDLTGLEHATKLADVVLGANQIVDLTPLEGLTRIYSLDLAGNKITDISQLAPLTKLNTLYLDGNEIRDISPLAGLKNLTFLSLTNNRISDISPLTGLVNLVVLHLTRNEIRDISPLAGLRNLTFLSLDNNRISDVSPLTELVNLGLLYLAGNPIEDLAPLRTLLANNPNLRIDIEVPPPPTVLTFTPSTVVDQTFTVGEGVNLTLPIAAGGTAPYTYTLTPLPAGLSFDKTRRELSGTPTTAGTTTATYTVTDAANMSASLVFTIEVTEGVILDVNSDGQVTVIDLAIVALFYGTQAPADISLPADVNTDGIVNILDLTAVAQGIDAAGNAGGLSADNVEVVLEAIAAQVNGIEGIPEAPAHLRFSGGAARNVAAAFQDAKHLTTDDAGLQKWMPQLQELLQLLREIAEVPETTTLLQNYPNPFNPETWIPYHLVKAANVTVTIYDMRGVAVRQLMLGHQPAGVYQSKHRAAYWDGRNTVGEKMASGLYFYTLTAGAFTATRKLLIAK